MFSWIFGRRKSNKVKSEQHSILSCAKSIIDNGRLEHDNSLNWYNPCIKLADDKGNTLYVSWWRSDCSARSVRLNNRTIPEHYGDKILKMVTKRIQELQKKNVEDTIKSFKR